VHRDSLSKAWDDSDELRVVGAAETVSEAITRLRDLRPDVALLDASMPALPPVASPPPVPDVKLVAVGVPDEEAVAWIEAGVSGYVPPEASLDDLVLAVTRVARGELVTSREVTSHILDRIRRLSADVPDLATEAQLTPRETEVLDLAAEGLPDKLIAQRLSIQVQTVKNHMQKILRKLGAHGRGEAAARMSRRSRGRPRQ
jgi:DNA-binding NarL/FixJ family response regulator